MTSTIRWSQAEIQWLDLNAGQMPFQDLMRRLHAEAKKNRWPLRTANAVICRLHRTGQIASCRHGEWLTLGATAELLGCTNARIIGWIKDPVICEILQPRFVCSRWYVSRSGWRRLAREMPRVIGGYGVDALFMLLENRELAEQVAGQYRATRGDYRIRCIETGRVYKNCGEAAAELHVSDKTISRAIRMQRPVRVLGLRFEALRAPVSEGVL